MVSHLIRRLWLVALLGLLGGLAALAATWGAQTRYERTLTYVVQPAKSVSNDQIPDAIRALASDGAVLRTTVAQVAATDSFLRAAAQQTLGTDLGDGYFVSASSAPDSNIIKITLDGPDQDAVARVAPAVGANAASWVRRVYRSYELDLLDVGAVHALPSQIKRTGILGVFMGLLLGLGAAYLEWRMRQARVAPTESRSRNWEPPGVFTIDGPPGRADELEASLRDQLAPGEQIVRMAPNRIGIVRPAQIPEADR